MFRARPTCREHNPSARHRQCRDVQQQALDRIVEANRVRARCPGDAADREQFVRLARFEFSAPGRAKSAELELAASVRMRDQVQLVEFVLHLRRPARFVHHRPIGSERQTDAFE